jgi:hypothetical protein
VQDYFLGEWVGEWLVVHNVHLFILQIHACSFGASWQGEMVLFFSVQHSIGRLYMG